MTLQRATIASLATIGLGMLVTGAALARLGGLSRTFSEFPEFWLLTLSPYALLFGACFLADSSRGRAIATLVVCALATACAIFLYGDLAFVNSGSMSGLVFFLVPALQLPAAIILLIAVFFTRPRNRINSTA